MMRTADCWNIVGLQHAIDNRQLFARHWSYGDWSNVEKRKTQHLVDSIRDLVELRVVAEED